MYAIKKAEAPERWHLTLRWFIAAPRIFSAHGIWAKAGWNVG
jgi:hypothetical protein